MAKIIYAPEAVAEIREAADYYENCREGLGQAFLRSVESIVEEISSDPLRWRKVKGRFRRTLVERFPYGIIYSAENDRIFIAAVMHLKRKPDYWKKRIKGSG